jgi:hypothetical protein
MSVGRSHDLVKCRLRVERVGTERRFSGCSVGSHSTLSLHGPCRERIMNIYEGPLALGALPVPKAVAEPPERTCYLLFFRTGIERNQPLAPDLSSPRATHAKQLLRPLSRRKAGTHGAAASNFSSECSPYQRSQARASEPWTPAFRRGRGVDRLAKDSCPGSSALRTCSALNSRAGTRVPARSIRPASRREASGRNC